MSIELGFRLASELELWLWRLSLFHNSFSDLKVIIRLLAI